MRQVLASLLLIVVALGIAGVAGATEEADRQPFLFRVERGDQIAYLAGSVHVGKADMYPLHPDLVAAFDASDALAVEADIRPKQVMKHMNALQHRMMYAGGETIDQHIEEETADLLREALDGYNFPWEAARNMKPFAITQTLMLFAMQRAGYDPNLGVDLHFLKRAAEAEKPILEVEGMLQLYDLIADLEDEYGDALLRTTIEQLDDSDLLDNLMESWMRADAEGIIESMNAGIKTEADRAMIKALLDDRNVGMADKVLTYLDSDQQVFVVVGAAHLVGDGSVVELLSAHEGVTVEAMFTAPAPVQ